MLDGCVEGEKVTFIRGGYESVGEFKAGKISEEELANRELNACPGIG